jgi:hypothetical protein
LQRFWKEKVANCLFVWQKSGNFAVEIGKEDEEPLSERQPDYYSTAWSGRK